MVGVVLPFWSRTRALYGKGTGKCEGNGPARDQVKVEIGQGETSGPGPLDAIRGQLFVTTPTDINRY